MLALLAASQFAFPALVEAAPDTFVCKSDGVRLHQLRIYEVNRANRDPFHQRFQDHALRIMKKHGFDVIDLWESENGEKLQFVYLLAWPDAGTMDSSWKAFLADTEWIEIKKRTGAEHGELVKSANGQPLTRVSYSPACKRRHAAVSESSRARNGS